MTVPSSAATDSRARTTVVPTAITRPVAVADRMSVLLQVLSERRGELELRQPQAPAAGIGRDDLGAAAAGERELVALTAGEVRPLGRAQLHDPPAVGDAMRDRGRQPELELPAVGTLGG